MRCIVEKIGGGMGELGVNERIKFNWNLNRMRKGVNWTYVFPNRGHYWVYRLV